jgi:hypothetical protein
VTCALSTAAAQGLKTHLFSYFNVAAEQAAEKVFYSVILSEAKNPSFFVFLPLNRREILRFAQNDRNGEFFRNQ